jgi:hypothetical protein
VKLGRAGGRNTSAVNKDPCVVMPAFTFRVTPSAHTLRICALASEAVKLIASPKQVESKNGLWKKARIIPAVGYPVRPPFKNYSVAPGARSSTPKRA